ncbi:S-adenosyl-L-methionine-dependent methyltransferase [Aspergillus egyptiacus]|nr:S-adenosyl-L-methionine-dependent methyltransferase [Aspergillus egyptiacus]
MNAIPEIYPLARDQAETRRLTAQHEFLVHTVGGLIDSAIPLDRISAVADVGTGTGIWLIDARNFLEAQCASPERYFYGFDISSAQFPPHAPAGVEFSVQNILSPFPAEHHNRYDLVYVRMLVTAIKKEQYQDAVANLLTILKPGGYLQWLELDNSALLNSEESRNPKSAVVISSWLEFFELNELSQYAPRAIEHAYRHSGMVSVVNTSFPLTRQEEDLEAKTRTWMMAAFGAVTAQIMHKIGRAGNHQEARETADDAIKNLGLYLAEGGVVGLQFGSVIGQKL